MKKIITVIVFMVAATLFPICAYAHSGGTDSNGGHYNRSTGEYHYHHGYSAHQHKDMDGDGKLDCPYDFKDTTKVYDSPSKIEIVVPTIPDIPDFTEPTLSEHTQKILESINKEDERTSDNFSLIDILLCLSILVGYYYVYLSKHSIATKFCLTLFLFAYMLFVMFVVLAL